MALPSEFASLVRKGVAARRAGQYSEAFRYLNEAAALCGPGEDDDRANVLRELGELSRNTQDLKAALSHYEQAVALLRNSANRLKFAHTLRHLGDVHAEQQHSNEAERCFAEALAIYRANPGASPLDLANAIRSHALLKSETGQAKEALELWLEAAVLYKGLGIAEGVQECRRRAEQLP
jgi:tetratricopeptide (TPR) repeat protein